MVGLEAILGFPGSSHDCQAWVYCVANFFHRVEDTSCLSQHHVFKLDNVLNLQVITDCMELNHCMIVNMMKTLVYALATSLVKVEKDWVVAFLITISQTEFQIPCQRGINLFYIRELYPPCGSENTVLYYILVS